MKNKLISNQVVSSKNENRSLLVNKLFLLPIIALLLLIIFLKTISAIGITPGRTTINFEPGLNKEVSFSVINSEHKDMSVVFTIRGDLADYIALDQAYAEFSSEEELKSFSYTIKLPQKFEKPGKYEAEIMVLEMPKDIEMEGATVGATVGVVTQLYIYVPYPNKYAEAEVNVVESGGKTIFLIPVINRGKLDIVNAKATIDIYSGTEEKVATIESGSESILSLERKELVAEWERDVNPGRYKAVVTLRYDNEVTTILKEFNVGEMFLEILEIIVRDFQLGEIAKFNALVENKWSSDLKEVYLNILVYNNEGETMADFKSPTYDISGLSKSEMVAYWDTGGVHKGTYDGKLILKYGEKSTDRNIQMKITDNSIEVVGLTGHVIVKGGGTFSLQNILIIAVVFLIIVNIVWFVIIKKIMKRKK